MRTFKNLTENVQEAITMPYGTDFNRPANPEEGMVRYNTTQDALEFYNGTIWSVLGDSQVIPNEVTDGLFCHWDASNSSSYSGTGSTVSDLQGTYDLTINGSVGYNSSGIKYFNFNGNSSNYFSYTNSILKDFSNANLTFVAWVNFNSISNAYQFIIDDIATSGTRTATLGIDTSGDLFGNVTYGTGNQSKSSTTISSGTWYQVAFTYSATDGSKLYVNVDLLDSNSNVFTPDFGNHSLFTVGRYAYNGNYSLDAKISDIKIYNRTLSSDEITQNFNATKTRFGL